MSSPRSAAAAAEETLSARREADDSQPQSQRRLPDGIDNVEEDAGQGDEPEVPKPRGAVGDQLASQAEADVDDEGAAPPSAAKQAGWGTEDVSKSMVQSPTSSPPASVPAFGRRQKGGSVTGGKSSSGRQPADEDGILDIAEIPDVEDEAKEDITLTVAANVHARSQTVQELQELDRRLEGKDGRGASAAAAGRDGGRGGLPAILLNSGEVDVSLLLSALCGVQGVDEGDGVWEFDALFSEVSSEMAAEQDRGGEDEDAEAADDGDKDKPAPVETTSKRPSITAK